MLDRGLKRVVNQTENLPDRSGLEGLRQPGLQVANVGDTEVPEVHAAECGSQMVPDGAAVVVFDGRTELPVAYPLLEPLREPPGGRDPVRAHSGAPVTPTRESRPPA